MSTPTFQSITRFDPTFELPDKDSQWLIEGKFGQNEVASSPTKKDQKYAIEVRNIQFPALLETAAQKINYLIGNAHFSCTIAGIEGEAIPTMTFSPVPLEEKMWKLRDKALEFEHPPIPRGGVGTNDFLFFAQEQDSNDHGDTWITRRDGSISFLRGNTVTTWNKFTEEKVIVPYGANELSALAELPSGKLIVGNSQGEIFTSSSASRCFRFDEEVKEIIVRSNTHCLVVCGETKYGYVSSEEEQEQDCILFDYSENNVATTLESPPSDLSPLVKLPEKIEGLEHVNEESVCHLTQLSDSSLIFATTGDGAKLYIVTPEGKVTYSHDVDDEETIWKIEECVDGSVAFQRGDTVFILELSERQKTKRLGEQLFIGEGNFSFTEAYINKHKRHNPSIAKKIIATDLSVHNISTRFEVQERVSRLSGLGVRALFGIDATKLEEHFPEQHFEHIRWVDPYEESGDKENKDAFKHLVPKFFQSCRNRQQVGDRVSVTISQDKDWRYRRQSKCQLVKAVTNTGYCLINKKRGGELYPGYSNERTDGGKRKLCILDQRAFVFEKVAEIPKATKPNGERKRPRELAMELMNKDRKKFNVKLRRITSGEFNPEKLENFYFDCSTDDDSSRMSDADE